MTVDLLPKLGRVRVTLLYTAALLTVTIALLIMGPFVQDRVIRHASTNLENLSHGHIGTLVGSAFVVEPGPAYIWLPGLVCLLALCEVIFCSSRLILAFAAGHIGATLLTAVGLTAALEFDLLSSEVTRASDVGMSYGAAGVLGGLTTAIPSRYRPIWIGWWIGVAAASALVGHDFTDVGHAFAVVLGMLVSVRFGLPGPWTPARRLMLAISTLFGFLVLANTPVAMVTGTAAGVLGALVTSRLARVRQVRRIVSEWTTAPASGPCVLDWRQRNSCAVDSIQSDRQDSGTGSSSNSPGSSHSYNSA
jgi:hypothetical protein